MTLTLSPRTTTPARSAADQLAEALQGPPPPALPAEDIAEELRLLGFDAEVYGVSQVWATRGTLRITFVHWRDRWDAYGKAEGDPIWSRAMAEGSITDARTVALGIAGRYPITRTEVAR
jgi:hypothetical protein